MTRVTLDATAAVLPPGRMSAGEIGALSGLDAEVVEHRLGIRSKPVADADTHVSDLAYAAGQQLLTQHGIDPVDIDAVCYFGSTWKDHAVWQVAPLVLERLGCHRAFALELDYTSAGAPVAIRMVRSLLATEEHLRQVLLVGASVESRLVDYADPAARLAYDFADGAVAALLVRDGAGPEVLGSHMVTDGSFSHDVLLAAGGSRDARGAGSASLRITDAVELGRRLDPVSMPAFLDAAQGALKAAALSTADVDRAFVGHLKPRAHAELARVLGVPAERMPYSDDTGHISGIDPLLGLHRAWTAGELAGGDICLLLAAGTGFTWAATVLRVPEAGMPDPSHNEGGL